MQLALTILVVIVSVALTVIVMLQSGKSSGLGAISGGAETFLSKNKAKSMDAKLARWTKYVAVLFMVLILVLSLI